MSKRNLSEDDTSAKFITPALYQAGWTETAIRRQVAFMAGRIIVRGKLVTRGKATIVRLPSSPPLKPTAAACLRRFCKRRYLLLELENSK